MTQVPEQQKPQLRSVQSKSGDALTIRALQGIRTHPLSIELWYKAYLLTTIKEVRVRTRRAEENELSFSLPENQSAIIIEFQGTHPHAIKYDRVIIRSDDDSLESRPPEPVQTSKGDTITVSRMCLIRKEEEDEE